MKLKKITFILSTIFLFSNTSIYAKQNSFTSVFTSTSYTEIQPNQATIYYSMHTSDNNQNLSIEKNKEKLKNTSNLLIQNGIKKEDIKSVYLSGYTSMFDEYYYTRYDDEVNEYNTIMYKSLILKNIDDLYIILDLLKTNDIRITSITFTNTNFQQYYNEELKKAIQKTDKKAEIVSKQTNKKLELLKISEENSVLKDEYINISTINSDVTGYDNFKNIVIPKLPVEAKVTAEYTY